MAKLATRPTSAAVVFSVATSLLLWVACGEGAAPETAPPNTVGPGAGQDTATAGSSVAGGGAAPAGSAGMSAVVSAGASAENSGTGGAVPTTGGDAAVGGNVSSSGGGSATSGSENSDPGSGGNPTAGATAGMTGQGTSGGVPATGGAPTAGSAGEGNTAGSAPAGDEPHKGVAFKEYDPEGRPSDICADLEALGVAWYYNWAGSTNCDLPDAEFVPQIWGNWQELSWVPSPADIAAQAPNAVLGFNEPDHSDQSNLSVEQALALWAEVDPVGVRVGSPATASDGQAWFESFMAGVAEQGLRVDFIAIHWYGWNNGCDSVSGLESHIEWAEQWGLPIWVTEWGCRMQSEEITRSFYNDAVAMFENHPLLERYAWFRSYQDDPAWTNGSLVTNDGALTPLGEDFSTAPRLK